MSFRFGAPTSSPAATSAGAAASLAAVQRFQVHGTPDDVPALLKHLTDGDQPRLRESVCQALSSISQRFSGAGEAARPLRSALSPLFQMVQRERDPAAGAAARAATSDIQATTSDLPAWSTKAPTPADLSSPHPEVPASSGSKRPLPSPETGGGAQPVAAASSFSAQPPRALAPAPAASWANVLADSQTAPGAAAAPPSAAPAQPWATKRHRAPTARELGVRPSDEPLFEALCTLRSSLAAAEGKGAHTICDNKTLALISLNRPRSRHSLLSIKGIGQHKADAFGAALLECVADHPRVETGPSAAGEDGRASCMAAGGAAGGGGGEASVDGVTPRAALSAEQARAVSLVNDGENLFLTGGAGTGKSFTLRTIIDVLHALHGKEHVFVTASTGIAACAIGGTTVHVCNGLASNLSTLLRTHSPHTLVVSHIARPGPTAHFPA